MPHLTRADNGTTFLHILHEIFDLDVGHPLALTLDDCGIATVTDLLTMTQEMIASLTYPNALQSYGPDECARELEFLPLQAGYECAQDLEVMPLQDEYKDILE